MGAEAKVTSEIFQKPGAFRSSNVFRFTRVDGMRATKQTSSAPQLISTPASAVQQHRLDERLKHMLQEMKDDDPSIRYAALRFVRSIDVEKIPTPPWELAAQLVVSLEDEVEKNCQEAARCFAKMAVASRCHLANRIEEGTGTLARRREAMQALMFAGAAASPHFDVIQRLAWKDPDRQLRKSAALCIGHIGIDDCELEEYINQVPGLRGRKFYDPEGDNRRCDKLARGCVLQPREGLSWRLKPGQDAANDKYFETVKRLQSCVTKSNWSKF